MKGEVFKNLLFDSSQNIIAVFQAFKAKSNLESFNKGIKHGLKHPATRSFLYANALPKKYKDLRKSRLIPNSGNISGELAWNLYAIKEYVNEINQFNELRSDFELNLIEGKYGKCKEILDNIETEICFSVWGLENRFILTENFQGTDRNWDLLSDLSKSLSEPLSLIFAENFSKKAENNLSYARFSASFVGQFEDNRDPSHEIFLEYLCFKLNYPAYSKYENLAAFLALDSTSSIIDRYNVLIDVVIQIYVNKDSELYEVANQVCLDLKALSIRDLKLDQLLSHFSNSNEPPIGETSEVLLHLDKYSLGDFHWCVEKLPGFIKSHPLHVEFYEIYAKSLIEIRQDYVQIGLNDFLEDVIENLYLLFKKGNLSNESAEFLMKVATTNFSSPWGKQLFTSVALQSNLGLDPNSLIILNSLCSQFSNPRILSIPNYRGRTTANGITASITSNIGEGKVEYFDQIHFLSNNRKELYKGRALGNAGDPYLVCKHFEKLLEFEGLSSLVVEESIFTLFASYKEIDERLKAVELYVNAFLDNPRFIERIDPRSLLIKLVNEIDDIVKYSINVPLFAFLANVDPYEVYVAYDIFMENESFEKPRDLLDSEKEFGKSKLILFLKEVCTSEVLHHSMYFDTSDDIIYERLLILEELLLLDSENENSYIKEITDLQQQLEIKEVIREVNKGRITINTERLRSIEFSSIKEGFPRFKEILSYSKDKDWKTVDTSSKALMDYINSILKDDDRNNVVHLRDPAFISFKQMFLEIRDRFLFDKEYGLDGYLSTRIRHGTLLNHIRSVFESFNLVSQKNSQGEYEPMKYWEDNIPAELKHKSDEIHKAIGKFSRNIDQYTESIIKERIQIKTEKSVQVKNGLFDYSLSEENLAYLFQATREQLRDSNQFIDFVFDYLEQQTDLILEAIRNYFNTEIKEKYESYVAEFQNGIRSLIGNNAFVDITTSITKCSTDIQTEIDGIVGWFNLSNPKKGTYRQLKTVIESSVELTNIINPNFKLNPSFRLDVDFPLTEFLDLIFIFRILLDNVIKHSGVKQEHLQLEIETELIGANTLQVLFTNNLSKNIDQEQLLKKLERVKEGWNKTEGYEKINIEGGSGFDKIRRILAVDMNIEKSDLVFKLSENMISLGIQIEVQFKKISNEEKL